MLEGHGIDPQTVSESAGTPEGLVERRGAYVDLGCHHIIVGFLPPYDRETMTRFAIKVRPRLEATVSA